MTLPAPPVQFSGAAYAAAAASPAYGEHTHAVLGELGLAEQEIAALMAGGVVGVEREWE